MALYAILERHILAYLTRAGAKTDVGVDIASRVVEIGQARGGVAIVAATDEHRVGRVRKVGVGRTTALSLNN